MFTNNHKIPIGGARNSGTNAKSTILEAYDYNSVFLVIALNGVHSASLLLSKPTELWPGPVMGGKHIVEAMSRLRWWEYRSWTLGTVTFVHYCALHSRTLYYQWAKVSALGTQLIRKETQHYSVKYHYQREWAEWTSSFAAVHPSPLLLPAVNIN